MKQKLLVLFTTLASSLFFSSTSVNAQQLKAGEWEIKTVSRYTAESPVTKATSAQLASITNNATLLEGRSIF